VSSPQSDDHSGMSGFGDHFRHHGYAVIEGAIPHDALLSIQGAAQRIVRAFDTERHRTVFTTRHQQHAQDRYFLDSAERVHCFLEEEAFDSEGRLLRDKALAVNKIGHALHDRVPEFRDFCRGAVIGETLRSIGIEAAELWQTMYIFKQPGIGGEVRWHQDATYLQTSPPSVVGLWVAVEDANRENGCLWVQPGGHRAPLREIYEVDHQSGRGTLRTLDPTPWPQLGEAVPVEVSAGSLVAFSDHLPHYSSANRSQRSRHAFTMHFAQAGARWLSSNWLQRRQLAPYVV
jgi:phytanoyl-CoA hydroxylase